MKKRWAIYFVWNDGTKDSFNTETAKERDSYIQEMICRGNFEEIKYCKIYANGEYGITKTIYTNGV